MNKEEQKEKLHKQLRLFVDRTYDDALASLHSGYQSIIPDQIGYIRGYLKCSYDIGAITLEQFKQICMDYNIPFYLK